jgi:hypothetical protein
MWTALEGFLSFMWTYMIALVHVTTKLIKEKESNKQTRVTIVFCGYNSKDEAR